MMSNMYEKVTTWNPLAGHCKHDCIYCSTKTLKKRFPACAKKYSGEYRLVESEFKSLGHGKTIFVCAQNDMFEDSVPSELIHPILRHCLKYPENIYMFQTKYLIRLLAGSWLYQSHHFRHFAKSSWFGTTIETNQNTGLSKAPPMFERAQAMAMITEFRTYLTIEPICDFDLLEFLDLIDLAKPDKIFIGAVTKGHKLPEPSAEKLMQLITILQLKYDVELKSNLKRLLPKGMK